jgi:predicted Rossmann fold flavoprotein
VALLASGDDPLLISSVSDNNFPSHRDQWVLLAIEAGKRGRRVLILDHASAPGEKIRISGGGRCNFTNIGTAARKNFLSDNPHFCISALSRYTPADFISLVTRHGIAFHEKALGQLFCDDRARQIIDMLLAEMKAAGAKLRLGVSAGALEKTNDGFALDVGGQLVDCQSLVIATGGKSIPKMGATGFAYDVARQFGLRVTETRPALVPLTFEVGLLEKLAPLSGVSVQARVRHGGTVFEEGMLFTHRGLSGPAILQISSYWREGDAITIDLAPYVDTSAPSVRADSSLARAYALFVALGARHVAVLDGGGRVRGVLTRKDLVPAALDAAAARHAAAVGRGEGGGGGV